MDTAKEEKQEKKLCLGFPSRTSLKPPVTVTLKPHRARSTSSRRSRITTNGGFSISSFYVADIWGLTQMETSTDFSMHTDGDEGEEPLLQSTP